MLRTSHGTCPLPALFFHAWLNASLAFGTGHAELVRPWDILTVRPDESGARKYNCTVRKGTSSEIRAMKDAANSSRY